MSKKTIKKKNAPPKPAIRLSQCMIVKNEEKNIEKALGWAKNVAYEQIVVDTGSTDRTVEIAKMMGAKVYHFEWINDFAAAKNYAIEQAEGNWIAFLDADEYLSPEDTNELMDLLRKIHATPQVRDKCNALLAPIAQINDQGKPFSIGAQIRFFRNLPDIRYNGIIHERLRLDNENILGVHDISIIHTGYMKSVYNETDKADRNIDMLRAELEKKPEDLNLKAYLADALYVKAKTDGLDEIVRREAEEEAAALYTEVASSDGGVLKVLQKASHMKTIENSLTTGKPVLECEKLCRNALALFPDDMDFECYLAQVLNRKKDFRAAWDILTRCEEKLISKSFEITTSHVAVNPRILFAEFVNAAQGMGDTVNTIKYATMILAEDKTIVDILRPYVATLILSGASEDEVIGLLSKLYDFNDPKDVIFVARSAKDGGAIELARKLAGMAGKLVGYGEN